MRSLPFERFIDAPILFVTAKKENEEPALVKRVIDIAGGEIHVQKVLGKAFYG